jgi:GH25 family lysozyme M1 (1,4-beta-N-acetylmuramidase)
VGLLVALVPVASSLGAPSPAWAAGCGPTSFQQNGVDVTQFNSTINFPMVAATGVKFVYARSTQGNYFTDSEYSNYHTQATAAGLTFGADVVLDPTVDAVAQANYFLNAAKLGAQDLIPALDVADDDKGGPSNKGPGVTAAVFTSRIQTWLNTVQTALDVKPLLFDDLGQWNTDTGSDAAFGMAGYPLWIPNIGSSSPPVPAGWTTWTFWLHTFTGTVPGISGTITDEDYFNHALNGGNLCSMTISGAQLNPPVSTTSPRLSGTPTLGQTLACSQGSWSNFPGSLPNQWLRDGAPIATAVGSDYTVTSADAGHRLSCEVTATNGAGSTPATTSTLAVAAPSASITAPAGGATYAQGQVVDAAYACSDQPSGTTLSSCAGPVGNGAAIDTRTAGAHTFIVTATDSGGAQSSLAVTYTVIGPPSIKLAGTPSATSGAVNADFACHSAGSSCVTVATLTTTETLKGHKVIAVSASGKRRHTVILVGSQTVRIAAGKQGLVTVRLNSSGKKLLKRFHRLPVKLTVSISINGKLSVAVTSRLTLKSSSKHKRT